MRFLDKRTNEIKEAFRLESKDGRIYVQFVKEGKTYGYNASNIEILDDNDDIGTKKLVVYSYMRECYKCQKTTQILTYIVREGTDNENLCYPWDKDWLNRNKSFEATILHMQHSEIEFYPVKVMGSDEFLDKIMMKHYPGRICKRFSKTQGREYPMNVCQHCGAKQGEFFIYSTINKMIQKMEDIKVEGEIALPAK